MNTNSPTSSSTHLRDYQPSSHLIPTIDLTFNLSPEVTIVTSRMEVISQGSGKAEALRLNADNLTFHFHLKTSNLLHYHQRYNPVL